MSKEKLYIQWLDPTAKKAIEAADRKQRHPKAPGRQKPPETQHIIDQQIASLKRQLFAARNGPPNRYIPIAQLSDELWKLRKHKDAALPPKNKFVKNSSSEN